MRATIIDQLRYERMDRNERVMNFDDLFDGDLADFY